MTDLESAGLGISNADMADGNVFIWLQGMQQKTKASMQTEKCGVRKQNGEQGICHHVKEQLVLLSPPVPGYKIGLSVNHFVVQALQGCLDSLRSRSGGLPNTQQACVNNLGRG